MQPTFREIDGGTVQAVASALALLEVFVKPLEVKATALADHLRAAITASPNLRVVDVDRHIAERVAAIRATHHYERRDAQGDDVPRSARNRHHVVRRPWRRPAQNQTARGSFHVQHDPGLHPRSGEPSRRIRRGLPPLADLVVGPSFGPSNRRLPKNVMLSVEAPGIEERDDRGIQRYSEALRGIRRSPPSQEFPRIPSDAADCSARQRIGNVAVAAVADEFLAAVGAGEDRATELAVALASAVLDAREVKLAQSVLEGGALSITRAIRLAEVVLVAAAPAAGRRAGVAS